MRTMRVRTHTGFVILLSGEVRDGAMSIMSRDICCCKDTRRLHVDRVKPLRGPHARALSPGVHLIRRRCAARYFQGAGSSQTGLFSDANLSFVPFAPSRSFLQVTRM